MPARYRNLLLAAVPLLAGCFVSLTVSITSDGGPSTSTVTAASDPAMDGDVREDNLVATAGAVRAGFDPADSFPRPEFRGFLSFPIGAIPPGALVESATVTLFVDRADLLPGSPDLVLDFDHVHYGGMLSPSAFDSAGVAVRSVLSGVRVFASPSAQAVTFDVVPELQADVDAGAPFFQVRVFGTGGLARIVDGGGNRAGGALPNLGLAPVLTVRFTS